MQVRTVLHTQVQTYQVKSLTILGPWLAPEDESFRDVISIFENATGAVVEYGGSDEFEQIINIDCQAGSPPDVAVFPQPGLAANIAATGCLTSLTDDVKDLVSKNYAAANSWINLSTYDDPYGASTFMVSFIE
jgi:alpha-glucoside transport system substrate-binding protein